MKFTDKELTIFVNTSDSFEDCWEPFFKLFSIFWPNCPFPIVLNTETKDYSYPGLNIRCTKVAENEVRRLGWSECLMRALDSIETPYILYLQEDYFLKAPVKEHDFLKMLKEVISVRADVVYLSGGVGPWISSDSALICELAKKAKWRLSLQAGIWKKSLLRSLLRSHETPWQLESYGSYRTKKLKERFCSVNRDQYIGDDKEIFPYDATGVVAGRWVESIVRPLFEKYEINVDFSQRGFHDPNVRRRKRKHILLRLLDRIKSLA